jgi:hypothetical protein
MTRIDTTDNYRDDLKLARAAGLSFPKQPKAIDLYAAIDAHNSSLALDYVTVGQDGLAVPHDPTDSDSDEFDTYGFWDSFAGQETTYPQPDTYEIWAPNDNTNHGSFEPLTDHNGEVWIPERPTIHSTLDCQDDDVCTPVNQYTNPVIIAIIAMVVVYLAARQLVKLTFLAINRLEQYWKSSPSVDYFSGLDSLVDIASEVW